MQHDPRFKVILREFFALFMALWFPKWARWYVVETPTWYSEETVSDPPENKVFRLDLVARVQVREDLPDPPPRFGLPAELLFNLETESEDSATRLRGQIPIYRHHLQMRYKLKVVSLAMFLQMVLEGIGTETIEDGVGDTMCSTVNLDYVALRGLDAEHYVAQDNVLGIALSVFMRIRPDRKAWLKAEALRRLLQSNEDDRRKFLLCECVQAYLPLEEPQMRDFQQLLTTEPYSEIMPVATTWYEQGQESGRSQGEGIGQRKLLVTLIEKRFRKLAPEEQRALSAKSSEELIALGIQILNAGSIEELGLLNGSQQH